MEFLLGPITRRINVLYESRIKWSWHHSKLAVEEVSFYGGLKSGTPSTIIYTRYNLTLRPWVWCSYALPQGDQYQVPIIRFVPSTLHQTLVNSTVSSLGYWQTGCLWWEAVELWFHLDLKSFCALKNNCLGFLLGHITRWINVIYGSRMKWT